MGEILTDFSLKFNGSVKLEARAERLTSEAGAVLLREVDERLGLTRWLGEMLTDTREESRITHSSRELVRPHLLLLAQGWRDQDDADALREDAALRLAVSDSKSIGPLKQEEGRPRGLASQPTLSRLTAMLAQEGNREVLRQALVWLTGRRLRASRPRGERLRQVTVDVDGLPVEVHGHQEGSAYNGHYGVRMYHPLVASMAETGDLLDVRPREGNVHSASGALDFISQLLERVEKEVCEVAAVRMDAGFPEEKLLGMLEQRGTPYVARVRDTAPLEQEAALWRFLHSGVPQGQPGTFLYESEYQARGWSRARRVVLVVSRREDELFPHAFWLVTSWTKERMSAEELLTHYRQRGTAEGHFGELMDVLAPALSSARRPKSNYQGQPARFRSRPSPTTRCACCSTPWPTTWCTPRACCWSRPRAKAGGCAVFASGCSRWRHGCCCIPGGCAGNGPGVGQSLAQAVEPAWLAEYGPHHVTSTAIAARPSNRSPHPFQPLLLATRGPGRADVCSVPEVAHKSPWLLLSCMLWASCHEYGGLTATPRRRDERHIGIDEIAFSITYRQLFERGALVEPIFEEPLVIPPSAWKDPSGLEDFADYILDRAEREFVKTLVVATTVERVHNLYTALEKGLAERQDHILSLSDLGWVHASASSAGINPDAFLDEFEAKKRGILVSTSNLLGEGFDDRRINSVVITYPSTSLVQLMQAAGRCLRYHPGKRAAYVVQVKESNLAYHFEQRWLYREISDLLHPQLVDREYSSREDLQRQVKALLDSRHVREDVRASILEHLGDVVEGETCSLLLSGLPYDGPCRSFRGEGQVECCLGDAGEQ